MPVFVVTTTSRTRSPRRPRLRRRACRTAAIAGWPRRLRPRQPAPSPATRCCSRRPVPASTSSATTSSEARCSPSWRRRCLLVADVQRVRRRAPRTSLQLEYHLLLLVTLGLVAFGLIMVYSASSGTAVVQGHDPVSVLAKQGVYAAVGIVLMLMLARFNYRRLRYFAAPFL